MQSVPITTDVVSANLDQGEVYSIQHYVMKFDSDLHAAGRWFSTPGIPVFSTNKADRHDIDAILLKVTISTIHITIIIE